jgi:hypothetical protein
MKKLTMMTLLVLAGLTAGRAPAQVIQPNYLRIQYPGSDLPPVAVMAVYQVNGINYPVDYAWRI